MVGADEPIPNRTVSIVNTLVLKPDGFESRWQQFAVAEPRTPTAGSNIPAPARVAASHVAPRGITVIRQIGLPAGAALRDAAGNAAVVALPPLAAAGIRLDGRRLR